MSAVFIPYREVFMNYAGIKEYDIANGPGIRFSLFVSGCTHHCKGCFNPDTWSFHYGKPFTKETEDYIIRQLGQDCYQGMTLLGGEPMEPVNQKGLLPLVKRFKETYPEKDLWCFSGYLFDKEILGHFAKIMPETMELLKYIDILVDGEFVLAKKDDEKDGARQRNEVQQKKRAAFIGIMQASASHGQRREQREERP